MVTVTELNRAPNITVDAIDANEVSAVKATINSSQLYLQDSEPSNLQDSDIWLDTDSPEGSTTQLTGHSGANILAGGNVFQDWTVVNQEDSGWATADLSTGAITVQEPGKYWVASNIRFESPSDQALIEQVINKNSTDASQTGQYIYQTQNEDTISGDPIRFNMQSAATVLDLAAGDSLRVVTDLSQSLVANNFDQNGHFTVTRVSE